MNKEDLGTNSLQIHLAHHGKIEILPTVPIKTLEDLSLAYTPGVGTVCQAVADDPEKAYSHTIKGHSVAVISDGSAVLGLGNIGPLGGLPVMEGKAVIFKTFAGLDAWPLVLNVHTTAAIVDTIKAVSPGFAGINLEDIAAPQCFEIEEQLQNLGIPVMHDDQHGTAIVVYAALMNAAKTLGKKLSDLTVVINGAGAAGLATARMLVDADQTGAEKVKELMMCDSQGIIHRDRTGLNPYKTAILKHTNFSNRQGTLENALENTDVFIGLSAAGALKAEWIKKMSNQPIIFAMANPIPEIYPEEALAAGAVIAGSGRSDFPNQINNALVFPGIFKAAIEGRAPRITPAMKYAAARGVAKTIIPEKTCILPGIFHPDLVKNIVGEVSKEILRN